MSSTHSDLFSCTVVLGLFRKVAYDGVECRNESVAPKYRYKLVDTESYTPSQRLEFVHHPPKCHVHIAKRTYLHVDIDLIWFDVRG